MSKRRRHRVEIRSDLVPDAMKIQHCCALESWGAAVNLVFALYRGQVLQRLHANPEEATAVIAAAQQSLVLVAPEAPATVEKPAEAVKANPVLEKKDMRSFLRQAKDEVLNQDYFQEA